MLARVGCDKEHDRRFAGGLQTESMKTRVAGATIWNCIWIIIFSVPGVYLCVILTDRARRLSLRM